MELSLLTRQAVAIRMACSYPGHEDIDAPHPLIVSFDDSPSARELSRKRNNLSALAEQLNLRAIFDFSRTVSPDILFQTLRDHIQATGTIPNLVALESGGLFGIGRTRREALRYLRFCMEKQKYTVGTDREETLYQRLAGKIALVTGSAQGFGKGIARELAHDGAQVVIADLNETAGRATCDEINREFGDHCAIFRKMDVSDNESVVTTLNETARYFGGIDIFVANAGVLKAGGLDELTRDDFDFVTKINYTGFFICARNSSALMKLQHAWCPDHPMDIVQINSKSGLQGSNRNFAYAGSKFGCIGLVQSFAMELIDSRIKVNAVCPGNFFDGPLWSDPVKGLFVQYLKAGKVPGATSIEDVKKFYMKKIPMGRGCLPRDVARAIVYAHEQEYETGQAIPVTGGQVMLN